MKQIIEALKSGEYTHILPLVEHLCQKFLPAGQELPVIQDEQRRANILEELIQLNTLRREGWEATVPQHLLAFLCSLNVQRADQPEERSVPEVSERPATVTTEQPAALQVSATAKVTTLLAAQQPASSQTSEFLEMDRAITLLRSEAISRLAVDEWLFLGDSKNLRVQTFASEHLKIGTRDAFLEKAKEALPVYLAINSSGHVDETVFESFSADEMLNLWIVSIYRTLNKWYSTFKKTAGPNWIETLHLIKQLYKYTVMLLEKRAGNLTDQECKVLENISNFLADGADRYDKEDEPASDFNTFFTVIAEGFSQTKLKDSWRKNLVNCIQEMAKFQGTCNHYIAAYVTDNSSFAVYVRGESRTGQVRHLKETIGYVLKVLFLQHQYSAQEKAWLTQIMDLLKQPQAVIQRSAANLPASSADHFLQGLVPMSKSSASTGVEAAPPSESAPAKSSTSAGAKVTLGSSDRRPASAVASPRGGEVAASLKRSAGAAFGEEASGPPSEKRHQKAEASASDALSSDASKTVQGPSLFSAQR